MEETEPRPLEPLAEPQAVARPRDYGCLGATGAHSEAADDSAANARASAEMNTGIDRAAEPPAALEASNQSDTTAECSVGGGPSREADPSPDDSVTTASPEPDNISSPVVPPFEPFATKLGEQLLPGNTFDAASRPWPNAEWPTSLNLDEAQQKVAAVPDGVSVATQDFECGTAQARDPDINRDRLVARMESAAASHFGGNSAPVGQTHPHVGASTAQSAPIVRSPSLADVVMQHSLHAQATAFEHWPPAPAVAGIFQSAPAGVFDHRQAEAVPLTPEVLANVTPSTRIRELARRAVRYAAYAGGGYLALVLVLIVAYRFVNPPVSTRMLYEGLFGAGVRQTWVPLERISPQLVRAVLVAEDGRFCHHYGIDFAAIGDAIENAEDGMPRGASTISMQVTKNLFLWQSKSFIRKAVELPLTLFMELLWPKSRILEVYLNIAEWGPGVFGAEAAAHHHFNHPAAGLSEREAAQLAAALPNPIRRDAGDPGPRLQRKAAIIQNRVRSSGDVAFCVRQGRSSARSAALGGAGAGP